MKDINKELKDYIEEKVLPRYGELPGHTIDHIEAVIRRSMRIIEQLDDINADMVYTIAAYHDLGRLIDDDTHNIESAKMLRKDEGLKKFFNEDQINTIAEAVEDHRASLKTEPRSIYGRIVSSADRSDDIDEILIRSYQYHRERKPDLTDEEVVNEVCSHLKKKYASGGYAKMYFSTPEYEAFRQEADRLTKNPQELIEKINTLKEKEA